MPLAISARSGTRPTAMTYHMWTASFSPAAKRFGSGNCRDTVVPAVKMRMADSPSALPAVRP